MNSNQTNQNEFKVKYSLSEILANFKHVFNLNRKVFIYLYLIELVVTIGLFLIFEEHLYSMLNLALYHLIQDRYDIFNVFIKNTAISYLAIMLAVLAILQSITTTFVSNVVLKDDLTTKESIKLGIKQTPKFVASYLVVILVIVSLYFIYFIFSLIPVFNYLSLITSSIATVLFLSLYRFTPYTSVIASQNVGDSFDTTQSALKGHLLVSMAIFLVFSTAILWINYFMVDYIGSHSLIGDYIVWSLVAVVVSTLAFILRLFDMTFIATAYKYELVKMKKAREKFINKW